MKTPGWLIPVFLCQWVYLHLVIASNPYFHLYNTSCSNDATKTSACCGEPPINPSALEIDFITKRSDNMTKKWQLDARINWMPSTTEYLEYALRIQPAVTLEELKSHGIEFLSDDRRFCVKEDELLSDTCSNEPFFNIVTNETSFYVEDLMFGFPYKLEIQTIVNDTAQLKYYCFNSCYDIFPKTVAPDCFDETKDRTFCENYPVPLSGTPSNLQIEARCVSLPDDSGWTVDVTWGPPVNVNGEVTHYEIIVWHIATNSQPPYFWIYYNRITAESEQFANGSYKYTIAPGDDFYRFASLVLASDEQYVIDIRAHVRLPETYNFTTPVSAGRATVILRTDESEWCLKETTSTLSTTGTTSERPTLGAMSSEESTVRASFEKSTMPVLTSPPFSMTITLVALAFVAMLLIGIFLALIYGLCCRKKEKTVRRQHTKFIPRIRENHYSFKAEPKVAIEFKGKEILDRGNIEVEYEPLGRGQYGEVYKGTLLGLKEKGKRTVVAFKTPKPDASVALKEDFLDEIKLMIEIGNHPHVMPIYGCCTVTEPFYLITEYMKYGALDKFLRDCRKGENVTQVYDVTEMNQVQIAWQISKGMSFIATTKYFHGDLAARNCLVGENLLVKISDFGLSDDIYQRGYKRIAPEKKRPVKWYSPEANFDGVCSTKGDVWSFGVVLWEIYTFGHIPYPGMSASQVVSRTKAGYRMPQPEKCPSDIYKIMEECWQVSPKARPNFSEIEYALEVILSHRAEVNLSNQQTSGDNEDTFYLPMADESPSPMIRRESSLADKINLYAVLGTSADSAIQCDDSSASSFTIDFQLGSPGEVFKVEPIIEEDEWPRNSCASNSSLGPKANLGGEESSDSISLETLSEGSLEVN